MAARVTQDEVRANTQSLGTTDASGAVKVANVIVQEYLLDSGQSEALLTQIELYLASHFLTLSNEKGPLSSEKIGEAEDRYHNIYDAGFNATRFGQQAIMLDSSGVLEGMASAAIKPALTALFTTVGSAASTDPDFTDSSVGTSWWPY